MACVIVSHHVSKEAYELWRASSADWEQSGAGFRHTQKPLGILWAGTHLWAIVPREAAWIPLAFGLEGAFPNSLLDDCDECGLRRDARGHDLPSLVASPELVLPSVRVIYDSGGWLVRIANARGKPVRIELD